MSTTKWTTVHPLPWRKTSFLYLPYWIHDIITRAYMEGKNWQDYADERYRIEIDTLKEAFELYDDVNYIESRNGYQYSLKNLTIDEPEVLDPPFAVLANPPKSSILKGVGVSTVNLTEAGTGYTFGDILDLPSSGAVSAQVRVTKITSGTGAIETVQLRTNGVYPTAPTNPVAASGGTGTGATFTVTTNGGVGSTIYAGVTIARNDANITYWGSDIKDSVAGYRGNGTGNGTQCRVNFKTDSTKIDFRLAGLNSKYDLYVDGHRISDQSVNTDASGATYVYTIDWEGDSKMRSYSLVGVNTAFGGLTLDTGKTISKINTPAKMFWQLGDSYTFGTMATQASFNDFRTYCDQLGIPGLADGIGGSGWSSTGSTQPQERIKAKLQTLSFDPTYIVLSLGYNDAPAGRLDLIKTNFRESVALIKQYKPNAKIIVIGPATPLGMTDQIAAVRDTMIELAAEFEFDFIDVKGWVTAENADVYTSTDRVHPNDAGYFYRGAKFANALRPLL